MLMLLGTHLMSYVMHKCWLFSSWVSVSCEKDVATIVHFLILLTLTMQNPSSSGTTPYPANPKAMHSPGQPWAVMCCHGDVEEG